MTPASSVLRPAAGRSVSPRLPANSSDVSGMTTVHACATTMGRLCERTTHRHAHSNGNADSARDGVSNQVDVNARAM